MVNEAETKELREKNCARAEAVRLQIEEALGNQGGIGTTPEVTLLLQNAPAKSTIVRISTLDGRETIKRNLDKAESKVVVIMQRIKDTQEAGCTERTRGARRCHSQHTY